jgi:transcription-repair coupling factor (superfamily II helicase)
MALELLLDSLAESCRPLAQALQNKQSVAPLALRRSAHLPVAASLYRVSQQPVLLVTDRADRALALLEELAFWLPQAPRFYFPEPTPMFYEPGAWGEASRRDRLVALTSLAAYHIPGAKKPEQPPLVISPLRALMTRTMPRRDFLKAGKLLAAGSSISLDQLARLCRSIGYESTSMVIASGQFARRGGILDLWPPAEKYPLRLEFFGDEIETLRPFDPATQRTIKSNTYAAPARLQITPAREFILPTEELERKQLGEPGDISEFYLPLYHPQPASLLDYLPRQSLILIDDLQSIQDAANEIEEQALALRQESIREETIPEDFPLPYLPWQELQDTITLRPYLEIGQPSNQALESAIQPDSAPLLDAKLSCSFEPGPRFGGRLKTLMAYIQEKQQAGDHIIVVSRQNARLHSLWNEQVQTSHVDPPIFVDDSLAEGWIWQAPGLTTWHLLTDGEIFGWRRPEPRRRARRVAEAPESPYSDLQSQDLVVHVEHGIGRFLGLLQRTVDGIEREYLCVEYADEAQLFVPVHQADRLTRYVGADNRQPALSRLGSPEWRSVKTHVKEAVQEVAEDLLDLYAQRSVVQGFSFAEDTPWQQELEASFPYIETDDQMHVLAEVKRDMESERPMDRLICGDVGYGKTEVALRAAFKAVVDGKQVAILVPTTILAQQHYNTFLQRLAAFPVQVEMLSRFRTAQQQRDIIERLAKGQIDIIIGTHRLLSSDVQIKELGLLIIDEEQRFGVTHKEALKKMRTEVDVLTLTATPIPRTLYMALSGVRDISTINTPPEERLPIVTHVGPYSPRLVRQAILREIERGGQVFFVHNRVQTIGAMRQHLSQLVPEARLSVAHGQMNENELSQRMEMFSQGEVDVLLSTSIIESGLDIPNANTLIVDRADTFGLAQLYQLRGRVGRGAQRAYAYFFRHKQKSPSNEGRQRLETIAENIQLGAGFSIAMRDLEIRGTGDILGTRQHGHIAAVGFHLYTSLLSEAVRRLRKEQGLPTNTLPPATNLQLTPVNVELPIDSGIPAAYVPDKDVRLGLYRRIADLRTQADLDRLSEEFSDRFGPPPASLNNLFFQLKIKLLAERAGLSAITVENGQLSLRFLDNRLPERLPDLGANVRLGKIALWLPYAGQDDWAEQLVQVLEKLQPNHAQADETEVESPPGQSKR